MNKAQALLLKDRIRREHPGFWVDTIAHEWGWFVVTRLVGAFNSVDSWTFASVDEYERRALEVAVVAIQVQHMEVA